MTDRLGKLLATLGLDFAAADFKTSPDTGHLLFLEVNTGPMFAAFNEASDGKLCNAIIERLTNKKHQTFRLGDTVRIRTGPFAAFTGRIEGINQSKALLLVKVEIYGSKQIHQIEFCGRRSL